MKTVGLTSESFRRVVALCDAPNVAIRVCEKDFYINQSILPFISTELETHFLHSRNPFIVSLNEEDCMNSLFESVTDSSLIESCSIFISIIENGTNEKPIHIPSLILFAKKIFCNDFLSSIIQFSSSQNTSKSTSLTFELSNFVLNSFSKVEEEEFSFKVCSKVYKCSNVAAAILSKKAFDVLTNENHRCIEVECPERIEQSMFEKTFESVFKILFGFSISVSNENLEMLLSISSQIENSFIFNSVIEFIESKDISNLETILMILRYSELILEHFDVDIIISKVSANFSNLSFDSLSTIPPFALSKILKSKNLRLESEDSLFDFLLKYFSVWNESSLSLFENIYFEYLSDNNLETFFKAFSELKYQFPPSIIQSLSFLLKSEDRSVHKTRHSSKQILNSFASVNQAKNENDSLTNEVANVREENNHLIHQTQTLQTEKQTIQNEVAKLRGENNNLIHQTQTLQTEKQTIQNEVAKLREENNNLIHQTQTLQNEKQTLQNELSKMKSESSNLLTQNQNLKSENQRINQLLPLPSIELFKHLRQKCNNQNPHKIGQITLSASSFYDSNDSVNIFEYSRDTKWDSLPQPNQWLLFDLKEMSFKIEKICFDVFYGRIPRRWRLLGSKNHQSWITIHEQGNDPRCKSYEYFVVDYDIRTNDYFPLFKFEALDKNYNDGNDCAFYSVEFIGRLTSK
jgi:hypothetical protein